MYNSNAISIQMIQYGDDIWSKTAEIAKSCSFQGSGQYLSELMLDNAFCDFERVFIARKDDSIIGFCTLSKTSCIENDCHTPWLDFLFVNEIYRGQGIARRMVMQVAIYAKSMGFDALYLCTASHEKMYQKFGFSSAYHVAINENTPGIVMKLEL